MTTMVTSAVTSSATYTITAEGVPEMAPVEESRESPAGSEGETDQVVMVPPLTVGVTVVMAVPFVKVKEFGL